MPLKQPSYDLARKNLFRNFTFTLTILSVFKKGLLAFIRPKECSIYNIIDPYGLKLLTRLGVNLSHLREHKFRHNFLNTLNPLYSCMLETESTGHYLLRCPFYADIRKTPLDNINNTIGSISSLSNDKLIHLLFYRGYWVLYLSFLVL